MLLDFSVISSYSQSNHVLWLQKEHSALQPTEKKPETKGAVVSFPRPTGETDSHNMEIPQMGGNGAV